MYDDAHKGLWVIIKQEVEGVNAREERILRLRDRLKLKPEPWGVVNKVER
jgi:hypothetical protein